MTNGTDPAKEAVRVTDIMILNVIETIQHNSIAQLLHDLIHN